MRPQVGNIINNKYRLLRLIGDGGMGSVFEARHEVLGTTVALKFLHPELTKRPGLVQRFLQEARVSAQIQSPHVVRVTDVDQTTTGLAFIVLEYIEGKTLQALYEELYQAGLQLSYQDALTYGVQMIEGVTAAHREGIVHRDLKPDNVMITKGARGEPLIKLLDFGIAKLRFTGQLEPALTRPGVIMGTPEYMAPEQAYSADAVDSRADIFSLGVMIFEMLAGRRPVGGDEPRQIASAYLSGQVAHLTELFPECSPELADVVHRAMAPFARDRYAVVDEFREAIDPFWRAVRPPSVHPGRMTGSMPAVSAESVGRKTGSMKAVSSANLGTMRGVSAEALKRTTSPMPASPPALPLPPPPPERAREATEAKPRSEAAQPVAPRAVAKTAPPEEEPIREAPRAGEVDGALTAQVDGGLTTEAEPLLETSDSFPGDEVSEPVAAAPLAGSSREADDAAAPMAAPAPAIPEPVAPKAERPAQPRISAAPAIVPPTNIPDAGPRAGARPPAMPIEARGAIPRPVQLAADERSGSGTSFDPPAFAGGRGTAPMPVAPAAGSTEPPAGTMHMEDPPSAGNTAPPSQPYGVPMFPTAAGQHDQPAPTPPAPQAPPVRPRPRKDSKNPSIAIVVLLALGIACAVVGGVYAADQYAKVDERTDGPLVAAAPSTTVPNDPPPPEAEAPSEPAPAATAAPQTAPRQAPRAQKTRTAATKPGTKPTAAPSARPPASTQPNGPNPPGVPPGLPPIVIPTSFPFPFEPPPPPRYERQQRDPRAPRPPGEAPPWL
jgi:eukaryotic-like serine/threonine-protein kinase